MVGVSEHLQALALLCEAFPGGRLESPTVGEAAVELAARGWAVFPTRDRDKPPRPSCAECRREPRCRGPHECGHELCHGVLDASTDLERVVDWFTRFPAANLGARVPTGLVVLDIDPRHGGDDQLAALVAEHGQLPATLSVRTGSGGWHYYMRASVAATQARLPAGVELKTPRGYCIMPPSVHPATGQPYEWHEVVEPARMPRWLVALTTAQLPVPRTAHARASVAVFGATTGGGSVAGTYSASTSWAEVLAPHVWRCLDTDPD
ncbi:MAG: bifunctional DNA primase/polymerase, partial [Actinomycetota bacterium]|nr:bifunctional DNA primase/polymerase [Actinomycetota bacterium]